MDDHLEAVWSVDVLPFLPGAEDDFGNPIQAWATTPVRKPVYGWQPAGTNEANASRHTVVSDLVLLAPPGFTLDPRDHVRVDGRTYEVEGEVEDLNHGPFGYAPGVRVNLRRFG